VKYRFLSLNHRGHKEHRAKGQKGSGSSLVAEMLIAIDGTGSDELPNST
jgi:hypothetical protein